MLTRKWMVGSVCASIASCVIRQPSLIARADAVGAAAPPSASPSSNDRFHFPRPDDAAPPPDVPAEPVSNTCRHRLRSRSILLLLAEQRGERWFAEQDRYQALHEVLESRLRAAGFRLYTQAQIRARIAQAEIDAYFKNDPDAALAASRKMSADYVLRGSIVSRATVNPVVRVNEVAVTLQMNLLTPDGSLISEASARDDAYAGSDTLHTALVLAQEQSGSIAAQLANEYCHRFNQPM